MEIDEDALYNQLKSLPDFECMPIPESWFKKYGIAPRKAVAPKEFIDSKYTILKAIEPKDLPSLIIDEPQQEGKLVEMLPPEDIKVEVINRPFEWDGRKPFPAVLPSLLELPDPDKKD